MSRQYLVTGGAGFIGSHICEALLAAGSTVIVLDDLSTGKIENLAHLDASRIEFIQGDIQDTRLVESIYRDHMLAGVYHEAAIASVQKSLIDPEGTFGVNVKGTENIFKFAVETGVPHVTFASSAAVYGDDPMIPKTETMTPKPISPYGEHKLENERQATRWAGYGETLFTALRYFNVFGERQDPSSEYSGVISIFMNRVAAQQGVTIFGDGEQTRDFIYVKDIVAANILALNSSNPIRVYNVATQKQTSLNTLIEVIQKIFSNTVEVIYADARPGDIKLSYASNERISNELSFQARFALEEGLAKLAQSLR